MEGGSAVKVSRFDRKCHDTREATGMSANRTQLAVAGVIIFFLLLFNTGVYGETEGLEGKDLTLKECLDAWLSPLAVVTVGGLMVSTFLTLLYVPIFYTIFEDGIIWLKRLIGKLRQLPKKTAAVSSVLNDEKSR